MANRSPSHFTWKLSLSLLVLVVLGFNLLAASNWRVLMDPKGAGTLATELIAAGNQKYEIAGLDPHSPLVAIGAKKGDLISFERKSDRLRLLHVGETVAITLHTADGPRASVIQAVLDPDFIANANVLAVFWLTQLASTLFTLGLSLVIGLRLSDSPPMRGFAIALLADSAGFIPVLPASATQDWISLYLAPLVTGVAVLSFLYFSLAFPQSAPWFKKKSIKVFFFALAIVFACSICLTSYDRAYGLAAVASDLVQRGRNFIVLIICISAMIALYASWRRGKGADRYRMAWIGASLSTVLMGYCVSHLVDVVNWQTPMELDIVVTVIIACGYFGLAFGLLRHRLLNISFAVNRTLVFTATSLMLFLAFWLIEQIVHKLVHFEALADNAMLSGAIAFGLFFAFNRLHHRVEHWIDHLFFGEWRANERALRQFMAKAAHFLALDALVPAFGAALDRFSDHAGNAIYLIGPNQQFELVFSTIAAPPASVSVDNNIAVTLRDTRGPMLLDVSDADVQGALVLPMLQGSLLKGFVVMGVKTSSQGYRPDEEVVLQAAAALIALDINRLEAAKAAQELAQMEQERKLLLQRQNFLEQELAALHVVLSTAVQAPRISAADLA